MCFAAKTVHSFVECAHTYPWITYLQPCGREELCRQIFDEEVEVIWRSGLCYACIHNLNYDEITDPMNPEAFVNTRNFDFQQFMEHIPVEEEELSVNFAEFLNLNDNNATSPTLPWASTPPMSEKAKGKQPEPRQLSIPESFAQVGPSSFGEVASPPPFLGTALGDGQWNYIDPCDAIRQAIDEAEK